MKGILKVARPYLTDKPPSAKKNKKDNGESSPSMTEKKDDKTPRGWLNYNIEMGILDDMQEALDYYGLMVQIDEDHPILKKCCSQLQLFNTHIKRNDDSTPADVKKEWNTVEQALIITGGMSGKDIKKDSLKWTKTWSSNLSTDESNRDKPYMFNLVYTLALAKTCQAFYNDEERFERYRTHNLTNNGYRPIESPAQRKDGLRTASGKIYNCHDWQRADAKKTKVPFRLSDVFKLVCGENFRNSLFPQERSKMAKKVRALRSTIVTEQRNPEIPLPWVLNVKEGQMDIQGDGESDDEPKMKAVDIRDHVLSTLLEKADAAELILGRELNQNQSKRIVAVLSGLIYAVKYDTLGLLSKKKRNELVERNAQIKLQEEDTETPTKQNNVELRRQYWSDKAKTFYDDFMSDEYNDDSKADASDEEDKNLTPEQMINYVTKNINVCTYIWMNPLDKTECKVLLRKVFTPDETNKTCAFLKLRNVGDMTTYAFEKKEVYKEFHANYEIQPKDTNRPPRQIIIKAKDCRVNLFKEKDDTSNMVVDDNKDKTEEKDGKKNTSDEGTTKKRPAQDNNNDDDDVDNDSDSPVQKRQKSNTKYVIKEDSEYKKDDVMETAVDNEEGKT